MDLPVSSERFQQAYSDKDNQGVMRSCGLKYARQMHEEDINRCCLIALWRTLRHHQDGRQKFTSSLFRFVRWELNRELARQKKRPDEVRLDDVGEVAATRCDEEKKISLAELVEAYLLYLPNKPRELVRKHYLQNHTLQELADMMGETKTAVANKIDRAVRKLRDIVKHDMFARTLIGQPWG